MVFAGLIPIMGGQNVNLGNRDFVGILPAAIATFLYSLIPNFGRKYLTFLQLTIASIVLASFIAASSIGEPVW